MCHPENGKMEKRNNGKNRGCPIKKASELLRRKMKLQTPMNVRRGQRQANAGENKKEVPQKKRKKKTSRK